MKKIIKYIILLLAMYFVLVPLERKFLINIEQKVTELENNKKMLINSNNELKNEISTILSVEKLNKIAEENKYLETKEKDIIHLK